MSSSGICHHFEEQLCTSRHNSWRNHWLQWPGISRRSSKRSVFREGNGPLFWLCSSRPFFWIGWCWWFCSVMKRSSDQVLKICAFEILLQSTKISDNPLNQPTPLLWSTAQLPLEIVSKCRPQSWTLSSNKRTLLVQGICQNEDSKSAVVVGLPLNFLKSLPH